MRNKRIDLNKLYELLNEIQKQTLEEVREFAFGRIDLLLTELKLNLFFQGFLK